MKRWKTFLKRMLILAFWLGVWALLARLTDRELLLPGPWAVARRLFVLMGSGRFWLTTAVSLVRILCGALAAILAGVLLAAATRRFRFLDAVLSPLLTAVKSVPVASFILLALIWVGRDVLPCVIVFLMVLPIVWANVTEGIIQADRQLLEMAQVYRFPTWRIVRRVFVPEVAPYFLAACHTSFGVAWKSGVAAEVLTVPARSIGRMLYESKLYLETVDLFAWTTVVVLCSLAIEKLLTAAVDRAWGFYGKGGRHRDTV